MTDPTRTASRRAVLRAAGLAAPFVFTGGRAFAADQIISADVGGAPGAAIRSAFYEPFEQETGIRVVGVGHEPDPTVQFKLAVDSRSYIWDLCMVTPTHVLNLTAPRMYLEPLNIAPMSTLVEGMLTPTWLGFSVFSTVIAYRTDKFGDAGPQNWADFWDVGKFPGRRGLYRGYTGVIEAALMADGVASKDLYPLDLNRAFRKLDQIKPHINVWWTSGAQNTQLLQSGELDMCDTWSARAYAAIDSGAPVRTVWNQGLYSTDGWSILRGTPKADLARQFIAFCMKPERQAAYSNVVANGPTNTKAFDFITAERARLLPTSAANLAGLAPSNAAWWTANRTKVQERFQDWLLG
ncbi:putative spermidine/putrescine transport system substrate-binding protein [Humitalea rosea]|uniref:Putative spermidine/putrescine transport system substrate-binding protein n=1 Tax=Humitalea rosea TaxID=990373 RepID=A0A2W7IBP6_9PROT|nr:ABC transporter substrate-binding protein [Humitalea rosea]PZW42982.1 putative spermidine/putrescine transport system substrate-binding protein [Humitalea rosea]